MRFGSCCSRTQATYVADHQFFCMLQQAGAEMCSAQTVLCNILCSMSLSDLRLAGQRSNTMAVSP